jgi:hypothetical protein
VTHVTPQLKLFWLESTKRPQVSRRSIPQLPEPRGTVRCLIKY